MASQSFMANKSFTKADTREIREIEKYTMFAGNIYHHRTSAQTGYGIEACFNQLITKIWTNINQRYFEKSGKNLSAYSGSVESQDTFL